MQKTFDYGFNGYRIPAMPRASRSARGNRFYKKKASDNKMYAFEILASVAGDLLCENATFPSNYDSSVGRPRESVKQVKDSEDQYMQTAQLPLVGLGRSVTVSKDFIKQEVQDEVKPYKIEVCDQGSSDDGPSNYRSGLCQRISHARQRTVVEQPDPLNDGASRSVSLITKCDSFVQTPYVCKSIVEVRRNNSRDSGETCKNCKPETYLVLGKFDESKVCPDSTGSCQWKTENTSRGCQGSNEGQIKRPEDTTLDIFNSEEPLDLVTKPPPLVSSDSSDEVAFCIRRPPCNKFPVFHEDVKVVGKDDDENSSGCSQPSDVSLKGYYPANHGDRKFRKLLTPTLVKGEKPHDEDVETGPTCYSRNTNNKRQRTQRFPAAKRRRLFQHSPISISERGGIESVDVSNSPDKCILEETPDPTSRADQVGGVSSSIESTKSSVKSSDAKVKLRIKSFKVPELLIEMPKSATIGALKTTVMEAVTSILSNGLQVGILLQGKRIHDDTKTLIQARISSDSDLEDVGFMLEPDTLHPPKPSPTDPCPPLSPEKTEPLKRYNPLSENSDLADEPAATGPLQADTSTCGESECDQISSAADLSAKTPNLNPQALIAIPTVSMEPRAVVPLHCKTRRGELVQRRIRRPFSVSEVEALVKAVEKLGTGRWRDIKLLAFDNAKHRTYVDLKDKWKTLVHTARISPQQRRGEPVPQELLDRVLAAHAHWSQHQAKHQAKQPAEAAARLLL